MAKHSSLFHDAQTNLKVPSTRIEQPKLLVPTLEPIIGDLSLRIELNELMVPGNEPKAEPRTKDNWEGVDNPKLWDNIRAKKQ